MGSTGSVDLQCGCDCRGSGYYGTSCGK